MVYRKLVSGNAFGNIYFLLPVACTLPASASYLEDLQNGISMYIMPRTSRKRYGFSKVVNCGLYGGLAAACSLLLLLVVNVIDIR